MNKIREILKQTSSGLSLNAIGRMINTDHKTVGKIIKIAADKNITYESVISLPDNDLYKLFYPNNTNIKYTRPKPDVERIVEDLKNNKSLTITRVWEEYKNQHPDGLGRTQFSERIRSKINERNITMHIERKPGEKCLLIGLEIHLISLIKSQECSQKHIYLFPVSE